MRYFSQPIPAEYLDSGALDTYAWPGGYDVEYVCEDSGGAYALCATCATRVLNTSLLYILAAFQHVHVVGIWELTEYGTNPYLVGYETVEEGYVYCDDCNAVIHDDEEEE